MLIIIPLWCIVFLVFPYCSSSANCSTTPFCDAYPECSRECLGGEKDNNISFFHSYGYDMMQICSTGTLLADHYASIFACINSNCTNSADGQAAWNQLVDDCGAKGFTVDNTLKPAAYSAHGESLLLH